MSRVNLKEIFFVLLATSFLIAGCDQKENKQQNTAQGGIDGSGGDAIGISEEDFDSTVKQLPSSYMPNAIKRLDFLVSTKNLDQDILHRFLESKSEFSLLDHLQQIKWMKSNGGCKSHDGHNDGAALPGNVICLSYAAFQKMSNDEAREQIVALAFHEFSHLRGFDEVQATEFQKFLLNRSQRWIIVQRVSDYSLFDLKWVIGRLGRTLNEAQLNLIQNKSEEFCGDLNYLVSSVFEVTDKFYPFELSTDKIKYDYMDNFHGKVSDITKDLCDKYNQIKLQDPDAVWSEAMPLFNEIHDHYLRISTQVNFLLDPTPTCAGSTCLLERNPAYLILQDQTTLVINKEPLVPVAPSKVQCSLKDEKTKEVLLLIAPDASKDQDGYKYSYDKGINLEIYFNTRANLLFSEVDPSAFLVQLRAGGFVEVVKSTHGTFMGWDYLTWLQKGIRNSFQVTFHAHGDFNAGAPVGTFILSCEIQ